MKHEHQKQNTPSVLRLQNAMTKASYQGHNGLRDIDSASK